MLYQSAALEDSAVVDVETSHGRVEEIVIVDSGAAVTYIHIFFDTNALPANSTAPDICLMTAATSHLVYRPYTPLVNNFVIAASTTAATLTVETANEQLFYAR